MGFKRDKQPEIIMETKLLFTGRSLPMILDAFDKSTDDQGYVIDRYKKRILDADGKEFKANDLIGIVKDKWITNTFQLFDLAD